MEIRAITLLILLTWPLVAQNLPQLPNLPININEILQKVIEYRDMLFHWLQKNSLYIVIALSSIPMIMFMYFDAKLIFRLLHDVTVLIIRRNQLLPIEKKWYMWRIGMKVVGIVVLSGLILLNAGALAWMGQFKSLKDMFAAMEKMRREENPLKIIMTLLESLRRR